MKKSVQSKTLSKWERRSKEILKTIPIYHHALVVFLSFIVGVMLFLIINGFLLPKNLPLPKTTAINWLVLRNHSLTLDYIRFFTFVTVLQSSMVVGWILFIWRKRN